jgi:hypothetical protein
VVSIINSVFVILIIIYIYKDEIGANNPLVNFSSRWFVEIGPALFTLILINIATNVTLAPGLWIFKEFMLCVCSRGCSCSDKKTSKLLQEQYMEQNIPDKFSIDERYTSMLVTLALCLFYGSGMPILYMAAAFFFLV